MDNIKIALKSLLSAEEYEEVQFVDQKPHQAKPDFLGMIKLKNPPQGKNPFIHLYKDDLYYTGQMLYLNPETGEKHPISGKIRQPGSLEIMTKMVPTLRSIIQDSLDERK
jgi:hypothetical protein